MLTVIAGAFRLRCNSPIECYGISDYIGCGDRQLSAVLWCRSLGESTTAIENTRKLGTTQLACGAIATTVSYHPQAEEIAAAKPFIVEPLGSPNGTLEVAQG
jgi:hypothetical protein